jgi:hypothetical protein
LILDATTPKKSPSPGAEIITNPDNEEINEEIVQGTHHWTSLKQKLISILRMRMSRDMSEKGRNWRIYMRMMNCERWKERNCRKV